MMGKLRVPNPIKMFKILNLHLFHDPAVRSSDVVVGYWGGGLRVSKKVDLAFHCHCHWDRK